MSKRKWIGILILVLLCSGKYSEAQYSAMTYNIRYATPNDSLNQWENRKGWVAELVQFYEPDVLGIQEGLYRQVQYLDSTLQKYEFIGEGRDDGRTAGEFAAIFYRSDKLEVLDNGTFWLSETPDEPSYGWGVNYRRISTWAKFREYESGKQFLVFNVHLDHEVAEARLNSVKLVWENAVKWNTENVPVLVMGDFNAEPSSPPIQFMKSVMRDSKLKSNTPAYGPVGTFNGFDTSHPLDRRIDYIFVSNRIVVDKYGVLPDTRYQRTPSDHLPVYIEFRLN